MEQVRAEGRYDLAKLPFLRAREPGYRARLCAIAEAESDGDQDESAALSLGNRGDGRRGPAQGAAGMQQISGSPCLVYAVDDTIVLPKRITAVPP